MLETIKSILNLIFITLLVTWFLSIFFWPVTILIFIALGLGKLILWFLVVSVLLLVFLSGI